MVKNLSAVLETRVWSLSQEDPLEKGITIHSSILTWRIPWIEEPGRLQSMGSQRVRHDWATNTFTFQMCVCVCVCMLSCSVMLDICVCIYIYIYIYIHTHTWLHMWPHHTASGILVPQPGIRHAPSVLEAQSFSHWTTREVPRSQ